MKVVPPGRAFRQAEKNRQRRGPADRQRGSTEDVIAAGARALVQTALDGAMKTGRLEMRTVDGIKYFRHVPSAHNSVRVVRDELLEALEQQLVYWRRAFNMIGGDKAVREALLGGDPVADIEKILKSNERMEIDHDE
jgi:hypothetical protein